MKYSIYSAILGLGVAMYGQAATAQIAPLTPAEETGILQSCAAGIEPIAVISDTGRRTGEMVMPIFDEYGAPVAAIPVSGPVLSALKGCDAANLNAAKKLIENKPDQQVIYAATPREAAAAQ